MKTLRRRNFSPWDFFAVQFFFFYGIFAVWTYSHKIKKLTFGKTFPRALSVPQKVRTAKSSTAKIPHGDVSLRQNLKASNLYGKMFLNEMSHGEQSNGKTSSDASRQAFFRMDHQASISNCMQTFITNQWQVQRQGGIFQN